MKTFVFEKELYLAHSGSWDDLVVLPLDTIVVSYVRTVILRPLENV
jgi:hypothetical protein